MKEVLEKIRASYSHLESILSSMKFAVVIIIIFTVALVFGTFMESYHGREFANRLVYKSFWFIGIQFLMFLSILTATLVRLPPKKRLYGFYTIHAGLILLYIGALITYLNGIDGMIELRPNSPTNKIQLDRDVLAIRNVDGKIIRKYLPSTAYSKDLNSTFHNFKLGVFHPYADLQTQWVKSELAATQVQSSEYFLYNDNVSESIILSLAAESDYRPSRKLGPLSINYMPAILYPCFEKNSTTPYIIWNIDAGTCENIERKNYNLSKSKTGNEYFKYKWKNETLMFYPNMSPLPLNKDLTRNDSTPLRVFSSSIFTRRPTLFLFGDTVAFYSKRKKKWVGKNFNTSKSKEVRLPWMGFRIKLVQHYPQKFPVQTPSYTKPIQDSGEIIKGDLKTVQVSFMGETHWVRNDKPLTLSDGKNNIQMMIIKDDIRLPYQLALEEFKMKKNPGTNDPASYESFVSLLDGRSKGQSKVHHIFMNNPLKYDGLTFYQSSYFPLEGGTYGSALSVNYDPGRFLKYFGSFLIVVGSIWHFFIRRKLLKKPSNNQLKGDAVV